MGDDFKSYQARRGLQYVQEKPKFIQDFMVQAGVSPSNPRREERPDEPDYDDELPVMVDSDGNILTDQPTPVVAKKQQQHEELPLEEIDAEEDYLQEALKEFEYEALDASEIVQQPTSKRTRTGAPLAVRDRPKTSSKDSRLLSFTMEDEEDA